MTPFLSLSLDLHLQIQTATFHISAASKSFNERDSAIVVSQIESRYPMSEIQSKTIFNSIRRTFPENVSQKWWGRGTDMLSASEWSRAEFSPDWGKTFKKFSRQWTIPGAVRQQKTQSNLVSHTEKLFLNNFWAFWSPELIFRNMAWTGDDTRCSRECCSCSLSSL